MEEDARVAALEWIPRPVRTRMDQAGVRISLAQWQAMALEQRQALAAAAREPRIAPPEFAAMLALAVARATS